MILTGRTLGYGVAVRPVGPPVVYTMIGPEKTLPNLETMGREAARWKATAASYRADTSLGADVARRATFADDVFATLAENLRIGLTDMVVAQASDGEIIGLMSYVYPSSDTAMVYLLAVDPVNLSGTPGRGQLRGIGTGLVATASRIFLEHGAQVVKIHPIDPAANTFWRARGFQVCGIGGELCIRGKQAIESLIGDCTTRPDKPDGGEVVICGLPQRVEAMRVPAARSR
jgi:hypothetical protein